MTGNDSLEDSGIDAAGAEAAATPPTAGAILAQARARHDVWSRLLSTELASAESPGYVEVGTHILAAATRAR